LRRAAARSAPYQNPAKNTRSPSMPRAAPLKIPNKSLVRGGVRWRKMGDSAGRSPLKVRTRK
jgi:hypothetical protein